VEGYFFIEAIAACESRQQFLVRQLVQALLDLNPVETGKAVRHFVCCHDPEAVPGPIVE
jgi:hypothetical protein